MPVFVVILLGLLPFFLVGAGIIFLFVFWIMMIVDVAKRDFPRTEEKIVWVLIILLAHILGAFIYYFLVKKRDRDSTSLNP